MRFLKALAAVSFVLASLAAEELDAFAKCDQAHDACVIKCDNADENASNCYEACEAAYDKCLTTAQEQEQI